MAFGGLIALTVVTAAACSRDEATLEPAPVTTAAAVPVTTSTTTVPPTTVPPTTAAPVKPVVTAVPVVVPISKRETTTTTALPQVPVESGDPWNNSFFSAPTGDTTPIPVGWISIPKIGLSVATYAPRSQGSQAALDRALDNGPTYWGNPVLPGQEGNAIVTGHRVSHGGPFRNIDQLTAGDEIHVTGFDGVPYVYLVESSTVIYPDESWWMAPRGGATLTLFSCHPPTSIRQRILVFATLRA